MPWLIQFDKLPLREKALNLCGIESVQSEDESKRTIDSDKNHSNPYQSHPLI